MRVPCRYAVAWYPVYRIPDAPLNARFLTFHSITPRPLPQSEPASRDLPTSRHLCLMASGACPKPYNLDIPARRHLCLMACGTFF